MEDITGISRGNPALDAMFKTLQNYQPDDIPTAADRSGALNQYISAVKNVGSDPRSPLQVALEGGLASDAPSDPFTSGTAGLKALLSWQQTQRESKQKQDMLAAQLQYQDILQRRKDAQALLLGQARAAMSGGRTRPIKLADGTWATFDPMTGQVTPLAASQTAALDKDYDTYYKMGEKMLDTTDPQVVHNWVMEQLAKKADLRQANPAQTPSGALPVPRANLPSSIQQMPQPTTTDEEAPILQMPDEAPVAVDENMLPPAVQEEIRRQMQRLQANPSPELHQATLARLKELQDQYGSGATALTPAAPKMKDAFSQEQRKGYGHQMGQEYAKMFPQIQQVGDSAASLLGDVNIMSDMYQRYGDQIPEGEQANVVANLKSSLKTFGVDVQGTGVTDVVRALGTKQALKSRTADGGNLLPGAMSNYEDMLLQKMSPTLTMTQQGRMMMLQIIKAQLKMKMDLAAAARDYVSQHKMLDQGWESVAADIAKTNPFLDPKRIQALEEYTKRISTKGAQ